MNKLTLIIDGGWMVMRYTYAMNKNFQKDLPQRVRESATEDLSKMMARSISTILNRFPFIDNIVLTTEGGSWRKQLPIPTYVGSETYKSNRKLSSDLDWNSIYKSIDILSKSMKDQGITVSQSIGVEGDDWIWYWTKRLNSEGVNCLIWSSDADLKQLVNRNENGSWTGWYNDKAGLVLPEIMDSGTKSDIEFFMHPIYISPTLDALLSKVQKVEYINPESIVIDKIIRGDNSDNIKSITGYIKNGRKYRVSEKDWENLANLYHIHNIEDLVANMDNISNYFASNPKYQSSKDEIFDMLRYNTKLVWLHESQIPNSIITSMSSSEYNIINTRDIASNYNILLPSDSYITSLFDDSLFS